MKRFILTSLLFLSFFQFLNAQNIVISEISYNTPESGSDSLEFIELYNHDIVPVNLNNWYFSSGVIYTFGDVTMSPGDYLVVATNSGAIENVFGYSEAYQWSGGGLSNGGEPVAVKDSSGNLIDSLRYDDVLPWPDGTEGTTGDPDGGGPTIILCDYDDDNKDGSNWVACGSAGATGYFINAKEIYGTPGTAGGCEPDCNTNSTDTQTACNSYIWMDGNTYTSSNNSATFTLVNAEGCDSVIKLDLTINATSSVDTQITCEASYTWIDGNTYNSSNNTASVTYTNSLGCDSVISLDLTIIDSITDLTQELIQNANVCNASETSDFPSMSNYVSYGDFVKSDARWVEIDEVAPEIASTNRSVSAWIKHPNQVSSSSQIIVGMNTSGTSTVSNFLIGTNEKVGIYDGGTFRYTNTIITDGEWHHVAYTYNEGSNGTKIYIDGELEKTYTNGQTIATNGRVSIGQEYDGSSTGNYFDGFITEVSIWNEELSESEVQLLMNSAIDESHPQHENLVAYYTMNPDREGCDTDLTDIKDSSENGLHGVASKEILSITNYEQISGFNSVHHFNKNWTYNGNTISTSDTLSINASSPGDYELILSRDHINITDNFTLSDGNCMDFNWKSTNSNTDSYNYLYKTYIDYGGHTYNTGDFDSTVDFDPGVGISNLTSSGERNAYLQKLNVDGSLIWVKQFTSNLDLHALGIVTDNNEDIYVTGLYTGTTDFDPGAGTYNLTPDGEEDTFIVKLDKDGNFLWATSFGGAGISVHSYDAELTPDGGVILSGYFWDGDLTIGSTVLTDQGGSNLYFTKINNSGNILWSKSISNSSTNSFLSQSIKNNSTGDIYIMDNFSGIIDLDPGIGSHMTTANYQGVYLVKLNSDGDFIEAITFGETEGNNSNQMLANSIDIAKNDAIYIAGYFTGTQTIGDTTISEDSGQSTFLIKINSSGNPEWVKNFGGNMNSEPVLAADSENNVYLSNQFYNSIDLDPNEGNVSLPINNGTFIVKISGEGNYLSSQYMERISGSSTVYNIQTSDWGAVQISGTFSGTYDFNPGEDGYELTSNQNTGFTVQYGDLYPNINHTYYSKNGGAGLQNGYSPYNAAANISSLNTSAKSGDTILLMENNTINETADVSIAAGVTLHILDGSTLNTENFSFSNNGLIKLNTTAALVQNTGGILNGSGNFSIDRFAGNNTTLFNFMSSPIDEIDVRTVFGGSNCVGFNPAEQSNGLNGWSYILTENLVNGYGYAVNGSNAEDAYGVRTFVGMANNGDIDVSLNGQTYGGPYDGWNLLGNPYPSALGMKNFIDNNSDVGAVTFYDQSAGMYVTYNTLNADGLHIPSGQGFFIEFSTANSGTTSFTNAMRSETAGTIERNAIIENLKLRISDNTGESYETFLAFISDATDGFDKQYDAKLIPAANELTIFTMLYADHYSIQGFAPIKDSKHIPLGMESLAGKTSISIADLSNFDLNTSITLIDHQEVLEHDLRKGDYTFLAEEGMNNSRFTIRLERHNTSTEEIVSPEMDVVYSDKQITISTTEEIAIHGLVLYDITGKLIAHYQQIQSNANKAYINIDQQANAIYLLEIHTDKGTFHKKVYLK